ncbi:DMT family transporter [Streptomyces rubiginosohelvolus]|uniref:DMT family transporter n=1 Tax=Streptomyces rubiginosohelvolus TaxID=67362 RepID=UPI003722C518
MTLLSIALALIAALGNAAASVLQRRAASLDLAQAPADRSHTRFGWMRRPVWFWGAGMLIISGAAQALALATGPLALVQPVMTTELLFTLVLAALVFRWPPGARTWTAFFTMAVGLSAILLLASPSDGTETAPPERWLLSALPAAIVVTLLVAASRRVKGPGRAAVLGSATAIGFAFTAALVKDTLGLASAHPERLLTGWQVYTTAVVGLGSFLMLQATWRAGSLAASQPALTLGDALLSVVLGVALFGEHVTLGWRVLPQAASLVLVAFACIHLSRSPWVSGKEAQRW